MDKDAKVRQLQQDCYMEFGNKVGNYTPAFSLNILEISASGYVKIQGGNVFCSLLVKVLQYDSRLVDLRKITSSTIKLAMIAENSLDELQLEVLHKNKVFKQFLLHAGRGFFDNNPGSQWDYYGPYGGIQDKDVKVCFGYAEWDVELVRILESAYNELIKSISMRTNEDSIQNGNTRKKAYEEIMIENKTEIRAVIENEDVDLAEFESIQKVISSEINL